MLVQSAFSTEQAGEFVDVLIVASGESIVDSLISAFESDLSLFLLLIVVNDKNTGVCAMIKVPLCRILAQVQEDGKVMVHLPAPSIVVYPPKCKWLGERRKEQT